jgi:hypothetical protein
VLRPGGAYQNGPFRLWPPDLPERVSLTATLIGSSESPEAVRLVPGSLRANPTNPRGYPRRLWPRPGDTALLHWGSDRQFCHTGCISTALHRNPTPNSRGAHHVVYRGPREKYMHWHVYSRDLGCASFLGVQPDVLSFWGPFVSRSENTPLSDWQKISPRRPNGNPVTHTHTHLVPLVPRTSIQHGLPTRHPHTHTPNQECCS